MAYNSSDNLKATQQEFEAGQLKLLEKIADVAPESVLEAAEGIGLLIGGTREKIQKLIPNHVLLFQRAHAVEMKKHDNPKAFVRAFEGVYGKFLFEQRSKEVTDPNSKFIQILSKVLSNRIDVPEGTAGAVEGAEKASLIALKSGLEAVARRLHMLDAGAKVTVNGEELDVSEGLKRLAAKKEEINLRLAKLGEDKTKIDKTLGDVDGIDSTGSISSIASEIDELQGFLTVSKDRLEWLARDLNDNLQVELDGARLAKESYMARANGLKPIFSNLDGILHGSGSHHVDLTEGKRGKEAVRLVAEISNRFDAEFSGDFTADDWNTFLNKDLKNLVKKLSKLALLKHKEPKNPKPNVIYGGTVLQKQIDDLKALFEDLSMNSSCIKTYNDAVEEIRLNAEEANDHKSNRDSHEQNIVAKLADLQRLFGHHRTSIEALRGSGLSGIDVLCNDYLLSLDDFMDPAVTLTADIAKNFITVNEKFLVDLRENLNGASNLNASEAATLNDELSKIEKESGSIGELLGFKIGEKIGREISSEEAKLTVAKDEKAAASKEIQIIKRLLSRLAPVEGTLGWLYEQISGEAVQQTVRDKVAKGNLDIRALETDIASLIAGNHNINDLSRINPDEILTLDAGDIERIRPLMGEVEFARNLLGIPFSSKLSAPLVEKAFATLSARFAPEKYKDENDLRAKASNVGGMFAEAKAKLLEAIANDELGPIDDPVGKLIQLRSKLASKKKAQAKLDKKLTFLETKKPVNADVLFGSLDALSGEISKINDDPDASSDVKNLCANYINAYRNFKAQNNPHAKADEFQNFVDNSLKIFLESLSHLLKSDKDKNSEVYQQADSTVKLSEARISQLKSRKPSDWVLEQAFPGVNIVDGVVKIRGFETNFAHVAKVLKQSQDYFESPTEVASLRENHKELDNLLRRTGSPDFVNKLKDDDVRFTDSELATSGIQTLINRLDARIKALESNRIQDAKNATTPEKTANQEARELQALKVGKLKDVLRVLNDNFEQAKKFHEQMKKMIGHLGFALKANVKIVVGGVELEDVKAIIDEFNDIDLRSSDFRPIQLTSIYKKFGGFFEGDTNASNLANSIRKAQEEIARNTNLSDAAAAKKILGVMINEQMPDVPVIEQQKLAVLIMANDVGVIQSKRTHEELAEKAGAEMMDLVQTFGFRRLIDLKYKVGEKELHPFKGLKPADFMEESKIREHFSTGRFNLENGFLALAGLEIFSAGGPESEQYGIFEDELRGLIAKDLGVKNRKDEAGIESIISQAFEDYIKSHRPIVGKFFAHHDKNSHEWDGNKIKELNARYKDLNEAFRRKDISKEIYNKRMAELIDETQNVNLMDQVDYSESSFMDEFWNSPEAQWLRDKGHDIGKYAGKKALRGVSKLTGFVAGGLTKVVGSRVAGVAGVGAMGTWKGALGMVKYPVLLAAKPMVGFINLFRKQKWAPLPGIRASLREDVAEVFGTYGKAKEATYGALNTALSVDRKPINYESQKYADRSKVDRAALEKQIEELKAKSASTAIEVGEIKIDMAKYKDLIKKMDDASNPSIEAKAA